MHPSLFFINLDRSVERAAYMWREIDKLGLRARTERIAAVDASKEPLRDAFRRDPLSTDCYQLEDTAIACTESHRKAWMRMLELDLDHAVFLEDDVVFSPGFADAVAEIVQRVPEFSVVKLDGIPAKLRLGAPMGCGPISLRPLHQTHYSCAAYMLSRGAAKRLLEETQTYSRAVDLLVFEPRADWIQYQADPALAIQGAFVSDSERARLPDVVAATNRVYGKHSSGAKVTAPRWFRWQRMVQRRLFISWPNKLWRDRAFVKGGGTIQRVPLQNGFTDYR